MFAYSLTASGVVHCKKLQVSELEKHMDWSNTTKMLSKPNVNSIKFIY